MISPQTVPDESYRLLQLGVLYVLAAFALAGVRARLLTPVAIDPQEATTSDPGRDNRPG